MKRFVHRTRWQLHNHCGLLVEGQAEGWRLGDNIRQHGLVRLEAALACREISTLTPRELAGSIRRRPRLKASATNRSD
ncbi:MAG: hypothetical protein ACRD3O_10655 [Terriglobia bacterium]